MRNRLRAKKVFVMTKAVPVDIRNTATIFAPKEKKVIRILTTRRMWTLCDQVSQML